MSANSSLGAIDGQFRADYKIKGLTMNKKTHEMLSRLENAGISQSDALCRVLANAERAGL